jgi:hypothetical protein
MGEDKGDSSSGVSKIDCTEVVLAGEEHLILSLREGDRRRGGRISVPKSVFQSADARGRLISPDEDWGVQEETADSAVQVDDAKVNVGDKLRLKIGSFSVEGAAWLSALSVVLFFALLAWISWIAWDLFA